MACIVRTAHGHTRKSRHLINKASSGTALWMHLSHQSLQRADNLQSQVTPRLDGGETICGVDLTVCGGRGSVKPESGRCHWCKAGALLSSASRLLWVIYLQQLAVAKQSTAACSRRIWHVYETLSCLK